MTNMNNTNKYIPHENFMGGPSYDLSPFATLYVMATSCFYGEPKYYSEVRRSGAREADFSEMLYVAVRLGCFPEMEKYYDCGSFEKAMKKAIEDSLDYDAELTLKFLAWLRNEAHIRTTPQIGMAIAYKKHLVTNCTGIDGTETFKRLDDTLECLKFYLREYDRPMSSALKRAVRRRLERADEYEMAKYRSEKSEVSLRDAVRIAHAHSEVIDKFMRDELRQTDKTWEAIISSEGSTREAWRKAVDVMGHMALLRNLRNLEQHGVPEELYVERLIAGVENGQQLPFRYYSAWQNVESQTLKEALNKCMLVSVKNLPRFAGKSLILVDNSGSAYQPLSRNSSVPVYVAGNLMGVLTGMVSDSGTIGVFGDEVSYVQVPRNCTDVLGTLKHVNDAGSSVGTDTENGVWLALQNAIDDSEHFDRIFIYSDMQAGHGGLYGFNEGYPVYFRPGRYCYIDVPELVARYRKKVNPECKLYSVQINGYADNIFPEIYPNTAILSGWSDNVLQFASFFEKNPVNIETMFREILNCPKKH